ncbi:MAG: Uma2 family endonuclease, partial [Hyphomicrobiaceae bacterium]|nr:Uma2 family endonuclease [Hyphomicrobiaceae bacterium]
EFLAMVAARPDGERWELIEGVAVLSPSPVQIHQMVVTNISSFLLAHKERTEAAWFPMVGIGTRVPVSPRSLPQPDVYVQAGPPLDSPTTNDALVIFEVLSRSNTKADQAWRKRVYASVPNCAHYVTVSLKVPEIVVHSRSGDWVGEQYAGLGSAAALPAIAVSLPLAAVYRWTPIDVAGAKRKGR